ncbi:F-box/lrr-repeat protein 15, partial [Biomphalaria glabrata]
HLHGIRLVSESLQKFYLFNLWNVLFVSVDAPDLRHITVDTGMESVEHLELFAPKLRRACINGSNVLRSINIK